VPVVTTRVGGPVTGLPSGYLLQLRDRVKNRRIDVQNAETWELGRALVPREAFSIGLEASPLDHSCGQISVSGIASVKNQLARRITCDRAGRSFLVSSQVVAPGDAGRFTISMVGASIDYLDLHICTQSERLTLGTPVVPPGAPGLSCITGDMSICPTGFDRYVYCSRVGEPQLMVLPQVVEVPFVASNTPGEARLLIGENWNIFPWAATSTISGHTWIGAGRTIGGQVTGLAAGQSVRLRNASTSETLTLTQNVPFVFARQQGPGSAYRVVVDSVSPGYDCILPNGQGVMGDQNVSTLSVQCADVTLLKTGFEP
jgi:hypothetical protein